MLSNKLNRLTYLNHRQFKLALLLSVGFLVGVIVAKLAFTMIRGLSRPTSATEHHEKLDHLLSGHLQWAEQEDLSGLDVRIAPVRAFFNEARQGSRGFAEDVLGWESKWILAKDYVKGEQAHDQFVEKRFADHIFRADQLEKLIESSVATYMQHLEHIDSELLVRLQADLEELPYDIGPAEVDREAMQHLLTQAIRESVASIEADFKGNVGRESISFVTGEVLAIAATRLATSAGILGVGAGTGTVTFMGGMIIGIIVDYIVSWAYDAYYDPVGEISDRLNQTLSKLEALIIQGDGTLPGLEGRLRDYAARRAQARTVSLRDAVLP